MYDNISEFLTYVEYLYRSTALRQKTDRQIDKHFSCNKMTQGKKTSISPPKYLQTDAHKIPQFLSLEDDFPLYIEMICTISFLIIKVSVKNGCISNNTVTLQV